MKAFRLYGSSWMPRTLCLWMVRTHHWRYKRVDGENASTSNKKRNVTMRIGLQPMWSFHWFSLIKIRHSKLLSYFRLLSTKWILFFLFFFHLYFLWKNPFVRWFQSREWMKCTEKKRFIAIKSDCYDTVTVLSLNFTDFILYHFILSSFLSLTCSHPF